MATATTIVQVCDAITEALRAKGFFEAEREDEAREGMVAPALETASVELGMKLTVSGQREDGGCTVMAEGVPGLVTIVPRRRVEHAGKGGAEDSVNPDFGVTWSLA
jgi:hypothetical protein